MLKLTTGPVVRFGPNRISVNTHTALKEIYGINANTQKSKIYSAFGRFFKVPATLTTIDKRAHSYKRRITLQALTPKAIKEFEDLMLENIRDFCRLLVDDDSNATGWSSARNMTKMVSYALSDIMGDITFSRNWDMQKNTANRSVLDILPLGTCGINLVSPYLLLM